MVRFNLNPSGSVDQGVLVLAGPVVNAQRKQICSARALSDISQGIPRASGWQEITPNKGGRNKMNSTSIALTSAGCIFLGSLLGLWLQRLLPGHHLSKETQDVVKLSAGTVATLTALVLGLLVSSAKSSFDTMNNGIVQSGAKVILLDGALARYGPETKAAREQMKRALAATIEMGWPTEKTGVPALTALERANGLELVHDKLSELKP